MLDTARLCVHVHVRASVDVCVCVCVNGIWNWDTNLLLYATVVVYQ